MFEAIYMAATGIQSQQRRMDTIADNVSNSNTTAFKTGRLDFKDALYTAGITPGPPYTPGGNLQKGHGVMVASTTKDYTTGNLTPTGGMLDFAIEGEGFFEVVDTAGRRLYTRAGNFYTAMGTDGMYMVDSRGRYVQNENGQPIRVPEGTSQVGVNQEGVITFIANGVETTDRFGVYVFANETGLSAAGETDYEETIASAPPIAATGYKINQGMLEASNVDIATEMTRMIRAQRALSLAARALTTADQMEGMANNLRR